MSHFEFIFSLYSLLLGLSLVELISGLGRTLKARLQGSDEGLEAFRIGWLTPLLGLFVMLDLLSFWGAAWAVRDLITVTGTTLMGVMLFASCYYLAAHLVFPDVVPADGDLDRHYFRVRRVVISVLFFLLFVQLAYYAATPELAPRLVQPLPLILTAILVILMALTMFVRSTMANIIVLALLIARYALVYIL